MPAHARAALEELVHEVLVEDAALVLRVHEPARAGRVGKPRVLALDVELCDHERLSGPRLPVLHVRLLGLPVVVVVDGDDVHVLAGHLEAGGTAHLGVPDVEAAAEEHVVPVVLPQDARDGAEVEVHAVRDEVEAVLLRHVAHRAAGASLARVEPRLRGAPVGVVLRPGGEALPEHGALELDLVVDEVADEVGVVCVLRHGGDDPLGRLLELRVEHKGEAERAAALLDVLEELGLASRLLQLAVVCAHGADDDGVGDALRLVRRAERLARGPRAEGVEAARLEELDFRSRPAGGAAELLLHLRPLPGRPAGDEARDGLGEEEVAGGVDHPPASVDLADAEEAVGVAHVRAGPAAVFIEGGVGLRRETGDAVHGDGLVGGPGLGRVLAAFDLMRRQRGGASGGQQQRCADAGREGRMFAHVVS